MTQNISKFSDYRFDADNWVVTLFRVPSNYHAEIAVEGIRKRLFGMRSEVFREFAHFRGPKTTERGLTAKDLEPTVIGYKKMGIVIGFKPITDKFKFSRDAARSWLVKADLAHKMMGNINKEAGNKRPFSIFGRHALINLRDFQFFNKMWPTLAVVSFGSYSIWQIDRGNRPPQFLLRAAEVTGKMYNKLASRLPVLHGENVMLSVIFSVSAIFGLSVYRRAVQFQEYKEPDNCVTWAQEKLRFCNIQVNFSFWKLFVCNTKDITDSKPPKTEPLLREKQ